MCTAIFFIINTKMANDPRYKEDQTAFRNWIGQAHDTLSELVEKLGESGMGLVTTSLQAPAVASDTNTTLLEMQKQRSNIHKQLGK